MSKNLTLPHEVLILCGVMPEDWNLGRRRVCPERQLSVRAEANRPVKVWTSHFRADASPVVRTTR